MFQGYSNFANGVDTAFAFIISISLLFFLAITITLILFIIKYNRKKNPVASEIHGSNRLEIIWTVIPTVLVMLMFWLGWREYIPMRRVPADAMKIKVKAQMWSWRFEYDNGLVTDTLYVPEGKAIALNMESSDVIHSLYVPAFRIKEDVVPGAKNFMWFKSSRTGTYDLFCTEYCGLRHSYMVTAVKVMPEGDFKALYDKGAVKQDSTLASKPGAEGKLLVDQKGCKACHTIDGSKLVGPSYKGLFGSKTTVLTDGKERTVLVDEAFVKKSIEEPDADVAKGFNKGSMVSYKGQLTEEQISKIAEYLKTLGTEAK